MRYYVYSTMAAGIDFAFYNKDANGVPVMSRKITVKGGHGIAGKTGEGINIITPQGVRTEITEDEYAMLKTNEVFNNHLKSGCMTVETTKINPEKVARDMGLDTSRPKAPGDFPLKDASNPGLPTPMPENKQHKFARAA